MTTRSWAKLKQGDWIVCPSTGRPEKVLYSRPYVKGLRSVRTSSHDHHRPATQQVEIHYPRGEQP